MTPKRNEDAAAKTKLEINGVFFNVEPSQDDDDDTQIRIRVRYRDLIIHPRAQRQPVQSHVEKLKRDFRRGIPVLHAVRYVRDGIMQTLVVDGQHSQLAALELGLGDKYVTVIIHTEIKDDEGAHDLFLALDMKRKISAIAKYRNEVGARHPAAVQIEIILGAHGLKVQEGTGEGAIRCPAALFAIHRRLDQRAMNQLFVMVGEAWGYIEGSLEGTVLDGLSQVIKSCSKQMDPKRMIDRLRRYPGGPVNLLARAKGLGAIHCRTSQMVATLIVHQYNVGLRTDDKRLVFKVTSRKQEPGSDPVV